MLKTLNDKLKLMRATRVKCEELAMTMEFLEGGAIKILKSHLRKYYDDHENDTLRNNVDNEVTSLVDLADKNRKQEDLLNKGEFGVNLETTEEEKKQIEISNDNADAKFGYLGWLNKYTEMSKCSDICLEKKISNAS